MSSVALSQINRPRYLLALFVCFPKNAIRNTHADFAPEWIGAIAADHFRSVKIDVLDCWRAVAVGPAAEVNAAQFLRRYMAIVRICHDLNFHWVAPASGVDTVNCDRSSVPVGDSETQAACAELSSYNELGIRIAEQEVCLRLRGSNLVFQRADCEPRRDCRSQGSKISAECGNPIAKLSDSLSFKPSSDGDTADDRDCSYADYQKSTSSFHRSWSFVVDQFSAPPTAVRQQERGFL